MSSSADIRPGQSPAIAVGNVIPVMVENSTSGGKFRAELNIKAGEVCSVGGRGEVIIFTLPHSSIKVSPELNTPAPAPEPPSESQNQ